MNSDAYVDYDHNHNDDDDDKDDNDDTITMMMMMIIKMMPIKMMMMKKCTHVASRNSIGFRASVTHHRSRPPQRSRS